MAQTTTKMGLTKPEMSDTISPNLFANNFQTIDDALMSLNDIQTTADLTGKIAEAGAVKSLITSENLIGKKKADATASAVLGDSQVRDIYAGTSDMTAGTTNLATGSIYIMYE